MSFSSEFRRAESSRCSSLSATCWVENTMSIRFRPSVPDRAFFSRPRYFSASSAGIMPKDSFRSETISPPPLTKQP